MIAKIKLEEARLLLRWCRFNLWINSKITSITNKLLQKADDISKELSLLIEEEEEE